MDVCTINCHVSLSAKQDLGIMFHCVEFVCVWLVNV